MRAILARAIALMRAWPDRRVHSGTVGVAIASCAMGLGLLAAQPARAVEQAEAAKGPPLTVAVFVSSRNDICYDNGYVAATERLVMEARDHINAHGGIAGRPVDVRVLDDARDEKRSVENVRAALADPTTIAMIGLTSSNRGKAVFDQLGKDISASGIPFLSDLSVSALFTGYPNVFTTRASQDEIRAPVMSEFTRRIGYIRPAYLGLADAVFSIALGDALKKLQGDPGLITDLRLSANDGKINPAELSAAVLELKNKDPDIIFLGAGSRSTPDVIKELTTSGFTPALFITGRISSIPQELINVYPNAIYQLAWDDLPDIYSNRIRRRIATGDPASWVFEGAKIAAAPGWAKGECQPRPETDEPNPLTSDNLRAIEMGAQSADMLGLLAQSSRDMPRGTDMPHLRRAIVTAISRNFAAGKGAYKGSFENWSFDTGSRTAARMPFVVIQPQGLGRTQLAPIQFLRARDGSLIQTATLYADIDLIKAHRIDDNEKSFFAEFYLSLRANEIASIDRIEFSNAYIDPASGKRQLTIETIHPGGASPAYPPGMKIYKIAGRFLFEPSLAEYPIDTQLFTIDIQPRSGETQFIVQPPPLALRDQIANTDGWDQVEQYVGTDEDFVPVVDAFTHEPSVVPFYRASFAWLMKRETTDYVLRVVVPLGFIMIVAYLSIFIPKSNFEAIVTIQVTALLSAVALYLALPAISSDSATLSDRMFVFVYMIVAAMIAISILRVNKIVAARNWLVWTLDIVHVIGIPILVAMASLYVYNLSIAAR
ncbi:MAG: ABC transporter substrate-binding protein [Hyphomicrobiaceae bacterium]|nr:ABC transporter substrate-binding protein [Hyphomicrobiaceae bacterium]